MSNSKTADKDRFNADLVWGLFILVTLIYGFVLAFVEHGSDALASILAGLKTIYTSSSVLTHDYFAMAGIGTAFVNSAMSGLLVYCAFKLAKLPVGSSQMGVLGLVLGFAFIGKNPVNMLPILVGGKLYSLYRNEPYKNHVTMAGFATCLSPAVSQPAQHPQIVGAIGVPGAIIMGVVIGLIIGFIINSMAGFIRKSHEGLNLYNVGWGAGLIAIALTAIYNAMGIERFGPQSAISTGVAIQNVYPTSSHFNPQLLLFLAITAVFFILMGMLAGGMGKYKLSEILYMQADDNSFYVKYGKGPTYLAMGILALLALTLVLVFKVHLNGAIMGSILSMIGWGGFGKAVANCITIITGVVLGGLARYLIAPGFYRAGITFYSFFAGQAVVWSSAFWGTCLSPMAKYFGWKWGIIVGMVHFTFASYIAPFHWGQNLYNNGLAAGFVCVVMIPIIRSLDKKGKYPPRDV